MPAKKTAKPKTSTTPAKSKASTPPAESQDATAAAPPKDAAAQPEAVTAAAPPAPVTQTSPPAAQAPAAQTPAAESAPAPVAPSSAPRATRATQGAAAAALAGPATGFVRALFDLSFRSFVTRRLAGVFFVIGLAVIAITAVFVFFSMIVTGMRFDQGAGFLAILAAIVAVPIGTFVAVIILRVSIEAVVAVISIAENTRQTAENTGSHSGSATK